MTIENITVTAKPIEWEEHKYLRTTEWSDSEYGFYIIQNSENDPENRFEATWGESDPECFATIDEAKNYCQTMIDDFVSSHAVITNNA